MDEVKLACSSSDERGAQEVRTQMDGLPDLCKQILQLLCTRLSDHSIMVKQEELRLMQRSSYYLEIKRHDLPPTADEQHHPMHISDSMLWNLIDTWRLQRAMALASSQVELLLTMMGLLYEEILSGCQELKAFIVAYNQGLADSDMAAHIQQRLLQTCEYLNDFESRMARNLGPLNLRNQLIPNTSNSPRIRLSASLAIKLPVKINRLELFATSNTVDLHWEVAGEQSPDLDQEFEIQIQSLHPTTAEHGDVTKSTCQSYSVQVTNLIPGRYYEFSIKRVDAVNLVYGLWTDTIVLKTLDVSSKEQDVPV
ncbi:fibronectin type III domain-containing protein 11-like [Anoplopoma fimbria]|uniref:fibronectin type III domain-containing protein 11-like n=1 Tax=Anoplopoma fimbria TaxID=229290 RepID=UPI0023EBC11C|nr:fibronectin type III domain-containing protein 11-like [Anoplopoma fimbria]